MTATILIFFAVGSIVVWAIRQAVEDGTRAGRQDQPVRSQRRPHGWHNSTDKRAR